MAESNKHRDLVSALYAAIGSLCDVENSVVYVDGSIKGPYDPPPKVDGFRPDLFVEKPGKNEVIIGEAKITEDLERPHSLSQYRAFFNFCSKRPGSIFIIAVPWDAVVSAQNILFLVREQVQAKSVEIVILKRL